ncbi:hypothetical protein D0863_02316 [Hortaea werneckii]|uniref:Uncharacterized protein n=1 Tax=Hortaea werneckii TaxID=91943 RepID=A0A3M7EGW4_HORWE|nr:hypothetical protein D0863_02316 [Hortaea werneckii]
MYTSPTSRAIIIIGRNQTNFTHELDNLHSLNPNGTYTFLETDISLIRTIDHLTPTILTHLNGTQIDLLTISQGYISFSSREPNAEGLDTSISLRYYGRIRLAQNLLPCMSSHARVLSILGGGGKEGKIIEDARGSGAEDIVFPASMAQFASMTTLSFDRLAREYPRKSFVHVFPGLTRTGLLGRSARGVLGVFMRWVVEPVLGLFAATSEDVGEQVLYYATSGLYTARGECWPLNEKGEPTVGDDLKGYRERAWAEKVWDRDQRMFERALSK